jgi:hypothetical protein
MGPDADDGAVSESESAERLTGQDRRAKATEEESDR